ncbi:LAETG motif-containing sortase-dependent surface protein [Kitasatospora sp. NPDC094028]
MRSSRLTAASALVALALGTTMGATTASAVGIPATPTLPATPPPTGTATAPAPATPSATATAPGTPAPTGTATNRPIPAPTSGPDNRCHGGVYQSNLLKVTGTGLYGTTLVKGGPAAEITLTWENKSGVDLPVVHNGLYVTDEFDAPRPVDWNAEFFDVQLDTGSGWKPVKLDDRAFRAPEFKLAKGEKITYKVRIAATAKAPTGRYGANYEAGSDAFDNEKVPTPANDKAQACTQFLDDYEGRFQVAEAGAATTPAAAPATVSASPSAGPHLAETGAGSSTLPLALGGAAVLAAGAGTLFVLRRRKAGAHS